MSLNTKSTFLAPGIALMNRLSYAKKFALLGFCILLAMGVIFYSLYSSLNKQILISQNEISGLSLIQSNLKIFELIQQHRGISASILGGQKSLESTRQKVESELNLALSEAQSDSSIPAYQTLFLKELSAEWNEIRSNGLQWSAEKSFATHSNQTEKLLTQFTLIADNSGITADPELNTYYLGILTTKEIPELLEKLGKVRGYSNWLLAKKMATPEQIHNLNNKISRLHESLSSVQTTLDLAAYYNPEIKHRLQESSLHFSTDTQTIIDTAVASIIRKTLLITPEEFLTSSTVTIHNEYELLTNSLIPTTVQLLDKRIQLARDLLNSTIIIATLVFAFISYFLAAIYSSTLGSIKTLSTAVTDYSNGNMQSRVAMNTQDELSQIGSSFNQMADHLSTLMQAQADSANQTQAILDNMVDGLIMIDGKGIVSSFNQSATRIFGYASDEVLGQNIKMLMPSPYRDNHDNYLHNYQTSRVAKMIGIGREVEGQRKDGSLFPMDLSIAEVNYQNQLIYVGLVRDISERKRNDQLKSEFVSTVSHELRTPLAAISGSLGLIAGGVLGELPEQCKQMIALAYRNSQRLTFLINDLLDIDKISAGKMHFEMKQQKLLPLIEQSLAANFTYYTDRKVKITLSNIIPQAEVNIDSQRLLQVLANLLSNAIKFSPLDGTVEVAMHTQANTVRVSITDHGPGIPQEFHSRIFQKFSQADSSDTRQIGGTGLGLAISRELMQRMGGNIGFESTEGHGATFYFELPLLQDNT